MSQLSIHTCLSRDHSNKVTNDHTCHSYDTKITNIVCFLWQNGTKCVLVDEILDFERMLTGSVASG